MVEYSKLSTTVAMLVMAAGCACVAYYSGEKLPMWVTAFLVLLSIIFGAVGAVTGLDWLSYHMSLRIKDIGYARVAPAVALAHAVKDLNREQMEAVTRMESSIVEMIVNDDKPLFMIRCLTRSVPYEFAQEYFAKSRETVPYMYPIRETTNKDYATEICNLIKARGWAEPASGPFSAKLTKPLDWVAERFAVEL